VPFLIELLDHPRFIRGDLETGFLDAEGEALRGRLRESIPPEAQAVAEAARQKGAIGEGAAQTGVDPWSTLRGYRG
jgi:hypothetical protein